MGHHFDKYFTLEQANALIPYIRKLFAEVKALISPEHAEAGDMAEAEFHNGNGHGTNGAASNGNGHGAKEAGRPGELASDADYSIWSDEKRHEAAYRLLNALQSQGIIIQDVERGLIDFPALMDGREILLCYELADGLSVQYYHEPEAGFAGRLPLPEKLT